MGPNTKRGCSTTMSGRRTGMRRGIALLEVVVAVSILVVAMGVVGAAFRNGQQNVLLADRMMRATNMTERLLTHMELGLVSAGEQEQSGGFGEEAEPGMSWKAEVNPDPTLPGLLRVTIHIYMGDPEGSENEHQKLLTTTVLRAEPRTINLETDFGFTAEQMDMLTQAIPGGEALLDPTSFDPRTIAQLDLETLKELIPTLMAALGGNMGAGGGLDALIQAAQRGDIQQLQQLGQQLGQQQMGGQPGQPGQGGQPPAGGRQGSRQGSKLPGGGGGR